MSKSRKERRLSNRFGHLFQQTTRLIYTARYMMREAFKNYSACPMSPTEGLYDLKRPLHFYHTTALWCCQLVILVRGSPGLFWKHSPPVLLSSQVGGAESLSW